MAFDLMVGTIEFDELPQLSRLLKRQDCFFLHRISNLFEDQQFSVAEIAQALDQLLPLLTRPMPEAERAMLHKLIAVLAFAQNRRQPLFGVAD